MRWPWSRRDTTAAATSASRHTPASRAPLPVTVAVDTDHLLGSTRDEYVSFNVDSSYQRNFFTRDLSNPALLSYASGLGNAGPSLLRM